MYATERHVVISPDGRTLASDANDEITLWDIAHGKELRTFKAQTSYVYVYAIAFTPDGQTLVSFSQRGRVSELNPDQTIRLWDIASGKELRKLQVSHNYAEQSDYSTTQAVFSLDGKLLGLVTRVDGDHPGDVYVYEVASGKELWSKKYDENDSAAFSQDAQMLASGGEKVTLWDVATGKELRTLELGPYYDASGSHHYSVWAIAFSPDGKTLASGVNDDYDGHNIKLWDIASGKELRTLRWHVEAIFSATFSLAFSPNGRKLASGGQDKVVRLWDVATGQELFTLRGHSNTIFSVAFTPDGNTLVSGSSDDTIKLWNVANGKELRTLRRSASGSHTVMRVTPNQWPLSRAVSSSRKRL